MLMKQDNFSHSRIIKLFNKLGKKCSKTQRKEFLQEKNKVSMNVLKKILIDTSIYRIVN